MTTGENDNTWGDQTNYNLQRLDDMVNQVIGVTVNSTSKSLTFTNDPTSYTQEDGRCKILDFTGSPGGTCTVTFPNKKMWYYVLNNTTGDHSIICTTGSGTTYTVTGARDAIIYVNGSNAIYNAINDLQVNTVNGIDPSTSATAGFAIAMAVAL
tara:strand:+ start:277 stop:738 length:462 start_codon:yes stop_codon:yes gene_type:complete